MSWVTIAPVAARVPGSRPAVTMGLVNKLGRNVNPRLIVTIRTQQIGGPLAEWWKKEAGVLAQIGAGEHAGQLRLSKGGPHKLIAWGGGKGKNTQSAPVLKLPLPEGVPVAARKNFPVAYQVQGSDLIIQLPDWAMPPAATMPVKGSVFRTGATAPDFGRARG